jgi:hypothetical protein
MAAPEEARGGAAENGGRVWLAVKKVALAAEAV